MDWIIWLIVIVAIVAGVWWLLNRNSRGGADSQGAGAAEPTEIGAAAPKGTGKDAGAAPAAAAGSPVAAGAGSDVDAGNPNDAGIDAGTSPGSAAPKAAAAPADAQTGTGSAAEWETQWSETPAAEPHASARHEPAHGAHALQAEHVTPAPAAADTPAAEHVPVHHREYTETHTPTLPGAESAAAEAAALEDDPTPAPPAAPETRAGETRAGAETLQAASSAAAAEGFASHTAEPSGHLAVDQPYGEGSAAPAADGSAPEGFTVKGDASAMTYHDESSPSYEETVAEVWFVSIAHAEAAGFRPPRRSRL